MGNFQCSNVLRKERSSAQRSSEELKTYAAFYPSLFDMLFRVMGYDIYAIVSG